MPFHNHSLLPIPVKASSQLATQQVLGTEGAYTLAAPTSNGRAAEGYNNRILDVTLNTSDGPNSLLERVEGIGHLTLWSLLSP